MDGMRKIQLVWQDYAGGKESFKSHFAKVYNVKGFFF